MKKRYLLMLGLGALLMTQACDDSSSKPKYKAGDACKNLVNSKGFCDRGSRVFCNITGTIVVESCAQGCEVRDSGEAFCTGQEEEKKYVVGASCGDLSSKGVCQDGHAFYCSSSKLVAKETCASGCFMASNDVAACKCGDITENGVCTNDTLQSSCNSLGYLEHTSCEDGKKCVVNDGVAACRNESEAKDPVVGAPCGNLSENGVCAKDNSKVYFCHEGVIYADDCADGCKIGNNDYAACKCGDLTSNGVCDGSDHIKFCSEDGVIDYKKCGANEVCEVVNDKASCVDKDKEPDVGAACGSLTEEGICSKDNRRAIYCDKNKVAKANCNTDERCAINSANMAYCFKHCEGNATAFGYCGLEGESQTVTYCDADRDIVETRICSDSNALYCSYNSGLDALECGAEAVADRPCGNAVKGNGYCSAKNDRIYCVDGSIVVEPCGDLKCKGGYDTATVCEQRLSNTKRTTLQGGFFVFQRFL